MHGLCGYGRQCHFPVLAHIEQRHLLAACAPIEKLPRRKLADRAQNTNLCAAVALISGSTTVSNRLSRIHSELSTLRTRMASMTGASPTKANSLPPTRNDRSKRESYTGSE